MSTETKIQEFVHKLEVGSWAVWVRRAVLLICIVYVSALWMYTDSGFRGLTNEKAIEQAQIAREITRGNGFSTKMIRPAALWQLKTNLGAFPVEKIPDTYHGPLNPYINSLFLRLIQDRLEMNSHEIVFIADKVLVGVQLGFYLLAVFVSYLTAVRLFDKRLAFMGSLMLLMAEAFWDFSMSGLPQMLMLFLFNCAAYALVRLVEARHASKSTALWCVALGALFGLLTLTHALTLFLFFGALFFVFFLSRPLGRDAAIIFAVWALFFTPWMIRNYQVSGNPLGIGWYSGLHQVFGNESRIMRTMSLESSTDVTPRLFLAKIRDQTLAQFAAIYGYLGSILVAPIFFVSLLHLFKRPETALLRWGILSMWLFGVFGMAVVGLQGHETATTGVTLMANDLHVLFIPLMTFYGLAFVLVLWSRLEIDNRIAFTAFMGVIYVISAFPFLDQLIALHKRPTGRVQWPPYVPPYIAMLNQWTTPREIIMSDMPWAVAWYADRTSLWLPMSIADFTSLNDYNVLGRRVVGLYLTPVSGNQSLLGGIVKGDYKEWAACITRQVNLKDFPLRAVTALPIDNECIFYADRDRWSARDE